MVIGVSAVHLSSLYLLGYDAEAGSLADLTLLVIFFYKNNVYVQRGKILNLKL